MKSIISLVLGFSILLASPVLLAARGGDFAGNGGDAVVCDNGNAHFLDLYEGETVRGFIYDELRGYVGLSWQTILKRVIDRTETKFPLFHAHFSKMAREFEMNSSFIANTLLPDIMDSGDLILPKGCQILQVAIQKKPEFTFDRWFLISKDIWEKMNPVDQAALVLHELIYREAVAQGHKNSIRVRYLNQFIFADIFSKTSAAEGLSIFSEAELLSHPDLKQVGLRFNGENFFSEFQVSTIEKTVAAPNVVGRGAVSADGTLSLLAYPKFYVGQTSVTFQSNQHKAPHVMRVARDGRLLGLKPMQNSTKVIPMTFNHGTTMIFPKDSFEWSGTNIPLLLPNKIENTTVANWIPPKLPGAGDRANYAIGGVGIRLDQGFFKKATMEFVAGKSQFGVFILNSEAVIVDCMVWEATENFSIPFNEGILDSDPVVSHGNLLRRVNISGATCAL